MKKNTFFLCLFIVGVMSSAMAQVSDSLIALTDKEVIKLSNKIYELEKKDSIICVTSIDDRSSVAKVLLSHLSEDSIHYFTGSEIIKLSNYIHKLDEIYSLKVAEIEARVAAATEYQLEEEDELQYFESVVYFKFDSYKLSPDSYNHLDEIANMLNTYDNISIAIEGYSDIIGSSDYNKALSVKRADAVKEFLIKKKKINPSKIIAVVGYGEERVAANANNSERTAEERAKSRMVVIKALH